MKTIIRGLLFRACLLVTLIVSWVFLTYGKDGSSVVHIVRNEAWNDLVSQIKFVPENSPEDSIDKEMVVIQKFLNAHQTESELISTTWKYSRPLIGHELACIKPIGTWKRHETSCPTRKGKQCLGGDLWNSGQLSSARNVDAPFISGEGFGFVYFKIPGKQSYYFFHRKFGGGDCWEAYLQESKSG